MDSMNFSVMARKFKLPLPITVESLSLKEKELLAFSFMSTESTKTSAVLMMKRI